MSRAQYIEYIEATNFEGLDILPWPSEARRQVFCPLCNGYGGWNTSIHKVKRTFLKRICFQCMGWGYVIKGSNDEQCVHEFVEISQQESCKRGIYHWGMFCHIYICNKCPEVRTVDSSG